MVCAACTHFGVLALPPTVPSALRRCSPGFWKNRSHSEPCRLASQRQRSGCLFPMQCTCCKAAPDFISSGHKGKAAAPGLPWCRARATSRRCQSPTASTQSLHRSNHQELSARVETSLATCAPPYACRASAHAPGSESWRCGGHDMGLGAVGLPPVSAPAGCKRQGSEPSARALQPGACWPEDRPTHASRTRSLSPVRCAPKNCLMPMGPPAAAAGLSCSELLMASI